ncbi:zona pellucida sperm-binding protein 4 [Symphorus nematophorus]
MAGIRVELLLVVLTGTLLQVSAWRRITDSELRNLIGTGQWTEPQSVTLTDDDSDYDNGEDELPEVEGAANTDNFRPIANYEFQVETDSAPGLEDSDTDDGFQVEMDSNPQLEDSDTDDGFKVEFVDVGPKSWTGSIGAGSSELDVVCSDDGFRITLPKVPLSEVKVLGTEDWSVMSAPASCGYEIDSLENTLTVPFSGCNVKLVTTCHNYTYSLQLLYVEESDQAVVATVSCKQERTGNLAGSQFPRSSGQPKAKCPESPTQSKAQNCAVVTGERVTCGQSGISSSDCEKMGCCVDSLTSACYYPLDECTADQHFVFAIRSNSATIPVDPTKLMTRSPSCKPVIVNDKVAIYKFKVTECGARVYTVGETKVYLAEVQTVVQALNLKYGVITRDDPLRFMVECRYSKSGAAQRSLTSVGYMVKTPASNLPSAVISSGLYAVELRIAKDETYSSYFPTYHQPLHLLLGKPVHLELRLKSPKPDAVILVNYCIAYPRSAKNALVLVYEGCANPYDKGVSILQVSDLPKNRHQRRFVVKAFQFMDQKTNKYLNEDIYFMCSTEVCRTTEKTCEERCFDGKKP